jgi:hypothetical protein
MQGSGDGAEAILHKRSRPLILPFHGEFYREINSKPAPLAAHRQTPDSLAVMMPFGSIECCGRGQNIEKSIARAGVEMSSTTQTTAD